MKRALLGLLLVCLLAACTSRADTEPATEAVTEIAPTIQPTAAPVEVPESWNARKLVSPEQPLELSNDTENYGGIPIYQSEMVLDQDTRWQVDLEAGKLVDDIGEASTGFTIFGFNSKGDHPVLYVVYQMGGWNLGYAPISEPDYTFGESFAQLTDPAQQFEISILSGGKLLKITNSQGFQYSHTFSEPLFARAEYIRTETQVGPQSTLHVNSLSIEQKQEGFRVAALPVAEAGEYMYVLHVSPDGRDENPGMAEQPLATLEGARRIVSLVNKDMSGDILVLLHGGVYPVSRTIRFTAGDSGSNGHRIIYRAAEGETPVLSGGVTVSGWKPVQDSPMWKAILPAGTALFRQLYVNGLRAQRAASGQPVVGTRYVRGEFSDRDGIAVAASVLPDFSRPQDLELHWIYDWKDMRLRVRDVETREDGSRILWMLQPYYSQALGMGSEDNKWLPKFDYPFTLENALELLDQPGEWYYNPETRELFYLPRAGEDLAQAEVIIPQTVQLMDVAGGAIGQEVHDLAFEGLTFAYAGWTRANVVGTYGWQAQSLLNNYFEEMTPAHIHLSASKDVSFETNRFIHMGASALGLGNNTQNITVQGNLFYDISDAALVVGHWDDAYIQVPLSQSQPKNNLVANNLIDHAGVEYWGASGINAYYVENLQLLHNELSNLPYTGISLGWGWSSYKDSTTCRNNRVANNLVTDAILRARDAGGIYTLGQQPGTVIEGNVIRRLGGDYGCLYPDEGSAYLALRNNVCDTAPQYLNIWINSIHDLEVENTYTNQSALRNNGINIKISNTVLVEAQNWPPEAQAIIDQAGLEPEYQFLRDWLHELRAARGDS